MIEGRPDAKTPHDAYFYRTEAVRSGKWKLKGKELFDLSADMAESKNLANENPDVVERLKKLLAEHKAELSKNKRPAGQVGASPAKKKKKKK